MQAGVYVRRVTAYNLAAEMSTISSFLHQFPIITIHVDHPIDILLPSSHRRRRRRGTKKGNDSPSSSNNNYRQAKARIDELDALQLGITLCDANGRLPLTVAPVGGGGGAVETAWQIGFSDFDLAAHYHHAVVDTDAVARHRAAGVDFEGLRARGVPAAAFARALFAAAIGHRRLTWVAFGGLYGFGFLLKILTGGAPLPDTAEGFVSWLTEFLGGEVYDGEYVAARLKDAGVVDMGGELVSVARALGAPAAEVAVPRQAGEKSLVACQVFMRMTGLFFAYHNVAVHRAKIHGLHCH
uniref:Uncharacterized protein n=1 Tax=Leersia perrieri TaxID=77586 RepID=A0A0D9XHH0_9ORYZ